MNATTELAPDDSGVLVESAAGATATGGSNAATVSAAAPGAAAPGAGTATAAARAAVAEAGNPPAVAIASARPGGGTLRRLFGGLLPQSASARAREYEQRFASNTTENLFRGVFDSAEAAQRSAPPTRPIGYDNAESAALYFNRMRHETYDYPSMFWLSRSLGEGLRSVFDVGGHIGIKFYAFKEPLAFPADLHWKVCDVAAVAQRGATAAGRRGVGGQLTFTSDYAQLDGFDVLFASGALQYLPMTPGQWLGSLAVRPRRLIINTTPIHPSEQFYTLNSIGTAYCPYRVMSEKSFLGELEQLGYQLRDRWQNPGKTLWLPDDPQHSLNDYCGFCFDLATS